MGLGVAGAFETARRKIPDQMPTHLVDHGLDIFILARLRVSSASPTFSRVR